MGLELADLLHMNHVIERNLLASRMTVWAIRKKMAERASKQTSSRNQKTNADVLITVFIGCAQLDVPSSVRDLQGYEASLELVTRETARMGTRLLAAATSDLVSKSTFQTIHWLNQMGPQSKVTAWVRDNKVSKLDSALKRLSDAIAERSQVLKDLSNAEKPDPEAPLVGNTEGVSGTPGVDLILELCKNSMGELPREVQDDIGKFVGSTSDECLYECYYKFC